MNKPPYYNNLVLLVLLIVLLGSFSVTTFTNSKKQEKEFDEKILILQKQLSVLQEEIAKITGDSSRFALSLQEIQNRQQVRQKSQDEILTDAVAKVSPAVVSIVIAKDVPLLEVVYQNPFGDDPFFRNFGFQIPVYRQKGVEKQKVGAGSGFLITGNGYILTNKHVVADTNAEYTVLLSNGAQKKATVTYRDSSTDIAIIKIDGSGYTTAKLGDSSTAKLGQTVVAIGNALGEYNNSISVGIISGLNRQIEATDNRGKLQKLTGVIQTDAAINPGNSGGPLIGTSGEVLGINVATILGSNNISFAIPVNEVKTKINSVLKL